MPVGDGSASPAHAVTLGVVIRQLRESLGWSQSRLATALCKVAKHETVSRWETGKRVPGPWWLRHLATVLQVPIKVLQRAGVDRRHFLTNVVGVSITHLVASDLIEHGFAAALNGGHPTADDWGQAVDTYGRDYMTFRRRRDPKTPHRRPRRPSAATRYPGSDDAESDYAVPWWRFNVFISLMAARLGAEHLR